MNQARNLTDFALRAHDEDNVATALRKIPPGRYRLPDGREIDVARTVAPAFKVATENIPAGTDIRKYGQSIGAASTDIAAGACVHVHNLASHVGADREDDS